MTPRTTVGSAQNLQLTRTARVAGEAFAFNEPEAMPITPRSGSYSMLWLMLALVAGAALVAVYVGF